MSAACPRCNDTGREGASDYLDCTAPGCNVAETRTKLEAAVNAHMVEHGLMTMQDMIWFAHQIGKAAVLEQAENLQRYDLESDYEGGNYMVPDQEYGNYVKVDDLLHALKP